MQRSGTAVKKVACIGDVGERLPECRNIPPFPDRQAFGCPVVERQQWSGFCTRFAAEPVIGFDAVDDYCGLIPVIHSVRL